MKASSIGPCRPWPLAQARLGPLPQPPLAAGLVQRDAATSWSLLGAGRFELLLADDQDHGRLHVERRIRRPGTTSVRSVDAVGFDLDLARRAATP